MLQEMASTHFEIIPHNKYDVQNRPLPDKNRMISHYARSSSGCRERPLSRSTEVVTILAAQERHEGRSLQPIKPRAYCNVNSGNGVISPPAMADSWAKMPTQVQLADCTALGTDRGLRPAPRRTRGPGADASRRGRRLA